MYAYNVLYSVVVRLIRLWYFVEELTDTTGRLVKLAGAARHVFGVRGGNPSSEQDGGHETNKVPV